VAALCNVNAGGVATHLADRLLSASAARSANRVVEEREIEGPMTEFPGYKYLLTETLDGGNIVRIMFNRPESRNAQNRGMLVELDDALLRTEADDAARVIILGGVGPVFSSGHDMGTKEAQAEREPGVDQHPTLRTYGGSSESLESRYRQEWHFFLDNTLRWRNLRKVTIAQVQGPAYLASAMLAWACDFIVAAEDAEFGDMAATRFGNDHVEYFAHPWELGTRKAKEFLMTGDAIGAEEAYRLGMVTKIFPTDKLDELTLAFARRIAKLPSVTTLLIKEAVNETQDIQGFTNSLKAAFSLHHLIHSHWAEINEDGRAIAGAEHGFPRWKDSAWAPPSQIESRAP
jgi:enoyl-CoA hydratase